MNDAPADITCRRADLDQIIALRDRVIIAGTNRTNPHFDDDDHADTFHLGAFSPDGQNLACLSLMKCDWQTEPAYQLRGMAVATSLQDRGIGHQLLVFAEQFLQNETDVDWIWCNARTGAAGFYSKHDWQPHGEPIDIAGVGPHVILFKSLR